ncbi:MAG: hypothetical protein L0387_11940 [Acidobacteria bacterium]|nr:hypothetical protein [Acidobacteriota bacterium]MCI0722587.1 hypothetical protein [Acidobacteriota bacterium]
MANEAFVLFRGRDREFGLRHRDKLISHGIQTLYISGHDQGQYGRNAIGG